MIAKEPSDKDVKLAVHKSAVPEKTTPALAISHMHQA